jgi:hypothetical protein
MRCSCLRHFENDVDPLRVPIIHASVIRTQFPAATAAMPEVTREQIETPVTVPSQHTGAVDGIFHRAIETVVSALGVVPTLRGGQFALAEPIG